MDVVIRLPFAPPQDYLLWLDWWEAVERIAGEHPRGDASSASEEPAASGLRLIHVHMRLVGAQARAALERGHSLVSPDVAGDSTMWEQALQHGLDRRDRLRELGREGIGIPEFPDKLVGLREAVVRAIRVGLEGSVPPPAMRGLHLIPRPAPGHYRLVGELDLTTVDQVEEVWRADLAAASPLRLDLAGVASMDSQGLRLLIRLGGLALERGLAPVVLANPSGPVQRVLKRAVPKGIPGVDIDDTESEFDGPPH